MIRSRSYSLASLDRLVICDVVSVVVVVAALADEHVVSTEISFEADGGMKVLLVWRIVVLIFPYLVPTRCFISLVTFNSIITIFDNIDIKVFLFLSTVDRCW